MFYTYQNIGTYLRHNIRIDTETFFIFNIGTSGQRVKILK